MHFNRLYFLALVVCFLMLQTSCSKKNTASPLQEHTPKRYPIGNTLDHTLGYEVITSKVIGPEGGSLMSIEEDLEINIPSGALAAPTEISVELITNTNPAGLGNGFRLKPHGVTFNKEVELVFHYNEDTELSSTHFLGVAYQDDKHFWRYIQPHTVDVANKKVKVKTNHFSDWALMQWMYLLPQVSTVKTNEVLELRAVRVLPTATADDGFLVPLVPPDGTPLMVGEQVDLETKYIKRWALSGNVGKLVPSGNKANYTAPATLPHINPVAISLELNMSNLQALLVSNVEVMGGEIEFRINGGNLVTIRNARLIKTADGYMLANRDENGAFALKWKGNNKWMLFNNRNAQTNTFQYVVPEGTSMYSHAHNELLQPLSISSGHIKLKSVSETAVFGTFSLGTAGHFSVPVGDRIGVVSIEGKFSAKKITF